MDSNHARDLLARERRRVEEALQRLRREPDAELSHLDQHPADEGSELFEEERDEGLADRLREELAAIERALAQSADVHVLRDRPELASHGHVAALLRF